MTRAFSVLGSCLLVVLSLACDARPAPSSPSASLDGSSSTAIGASTRQFAVEIFVDRVMPTHAGPGPHPTTESDDYSLMQGGLRWLAGPTINYWIRGPEAIAGGNAAIEASAATVDALVTSRTFTRVFVNPTANPCGEFNTILWAPIDGPGGALATTAVCRDVATKEIAGFFMTLDSDETWATTGAITAIDVANTATHEWGHVAGLGHVNGPLGGCLTMFKFATEGETQKRTLGLGDKLGLNALYGSGDTSPGPGCGN